MKVRIFLVLLFLFLNECLTAQTSFKEAVTGFLEQPGYKHASVGIHVADVETGSTVFELNGEKLLIPASVLKLVTSATALELLGSDYRFQTRLGYSGKIEKGTLKGNLIIIGGGDPALGSEYFPNHYFHPHFLETWAKRIKAAGIKRVEGNLVMDGSLYDSEKIPPTWIWEDMGNYYGAGTSALTVYDNLFRIRFRSPPAAGQPTEIISMAPKVEELEWKNEVLSSNDNRDLAYVFGSPIDARRVIRGTIPRNRKVFTIKASNPFPEQLLAEDFLNHLARAGVFVSGKTVVEKVSPKVFQQVDVLYSPFLSEIVKALNQESINIFAEHLVKQMAAEKTGTGNREAGLKMIAEFWEDKGLNTQHLFMEDGSGLSHFNAVSPAFLTSLLCYMENTSLNYFPFYESLPVAGQGTVYQFNPDKFSTNSLRIKSGSMKRVRCYAGYIQSEKGKNYAFSFMVNHFSGSHSQLIPELKKLIYKLQHD